MTDYFELIPADFLGTANLLDPLRGSVTGKLMVASGPVEFDEPLHWQLTNKRPATDWLMGLMPTILLTERFRAVLDANVGPRDHIQWIESEVKLLDDTTAPYWTPHFPHPVDVLDEARTQWGPSGAPMRWFLSRGKLDQVRVTKVPMTGLSFVVDAETLSDLQRERLTGFQALQARIIE
ncbi:UNVERIFIED_CONTAM: hypothetical protein OHV15_03585 [Microbacterium sp. SLM126]